MKAGIDDSCRRYGVPPKGVRCDGQLSPKGMLREPARRAEVGWIVEIYLAEGIFDPQSKTTINK
jgi:hypothetical protein